MKEDPPGSGFWVAEIPVRDAGRGRQLLHRGARRKRQAARVQGDGAADAEDHDDRAGRAAAGQAAKKPPKDAEPDEGPSLFFGIGVGGGVGWATGKGEVNAMDVVASRRASRLSKLLHFSPEIGYFLSPELLLSVQLRFQLISGANEFHSTNATGVRRRHLLAGHVRVRGLAKYQLPVRRGRLPHLRLRHRWAGHDPPRRDVRVAGELWRACGTGMTGTRSASTRFRRGRCSSVPAPA